MLRAGNVGLRARDEADVAVLHAELYEDIVTRMRADSRPWRPIPAGSSASPYAIGEPRDDLACFSAVELASGDLAGEALLYPPFQTTRQSRARRSARLGCMPASVSSRQ